MVIQPTPEQLQIVEKARGRQNNPSGQTNPGDQTPAQIAMLARVKAKNQPTQAAPVEKQRGRTAAQGFTFGFGEEIEAAVRSILPESWGGGDYDVIRDELRQKLSAYQQANPGESLSLEVIGAVAPTIAAQFIPGLGQAALSTTALRVGNVAKTSGQTALEAGKFLGTNAGLGGVAGLGYSEQEDSGGMASDAGTGAMWGGVGGVAAQGVMRVAGHGIGKGVQKFTNREGTDTAAQAYLNRLVQQTGLNVDDLVEAIRNGDVIADFAQLSPDIKSLVNMGGASSAEILQKSGQRSAVTQQGAIQGLHDNLAPGADSNVLRTVRQSEEALQQAQGESYSKVFNTMPRVPNDVAAKMLEVAKRNPEALKEMQRITMTNGQSPLFKLSKDADPEFSRWPSLEDSEQLLRGLTTIKDKAFKNENGNYGHALGNLEDEYRPKINVASPELAGVRQGWADNTNLKELYMLGRKKVLSMDVDELALEVEALGAKQLDSLRLGVMSAIQNRLTLKTSPLEDLTKDTRKMGIALRLILPPKQAESVLDKLRIGNNARLADGYIQPKAGAATNILGVKQKGAMDGINAEDALNLTNPGTVIRMFRIMINNTRPGLSDQQRSQIAKNLYETDPDLVIKALTSAENSTALNLQVKRAIDGLVKGSRNVSGQQLTQDNIE